DVTVELNGTDVTAAFRPDPAGNHHLEGVLTGLPLGESTVAVRVRGPGKARPNRVELAIVNHPIIGPMFRGPRQEGFLCSSGGHPHGAPSRSDMLYEPGLALGYAIAYSTGTTTDTHYNLQLGAETAIMVKSRFVVAYAEPKYTVGVGASGGAVQQYVYGQNHPGLIDAGVPQYSYPDMVTQTIHVGDCELLERWLDSKVLADPLSKWRTWANRRLVEGLNTSEVMPNPFAPLMPYMPRLGSTECINGWRGLSPLVLNPHFGTAPGITPEQQAAVEW